MKKTKKILAGLLMCGVLSTGGLLAGCLGGGEKENLTTTDIYGFAGVTTAMLAADEKVVGTMMKANSTDTGWTTQLEETISTSLDKYMSVFDSVIGDKKPVSVKEEMVDLEYAELYSHKLTITSSMITGETTKYDLYFNETLLADDKVEIDDINDEERETKLSGIMVVDGDETSVLYVEGKKELELGEMEIEFEASVFQSGQERDNNKVVFKQEIEKQHAETEEEYLFEIYVGGVKTELEFSLEKDVRGNVEVEYEHQIGSDYVNFEIEKNRGLIILETIDFLGNELKVSISSEKNPDDENQVRYVYTVMLDDLGGTGNFVCYGAWRTVENDIVA